MNVDLKSIHPRDLEFLKSLASDSAFKTRKPIELSALRGLVTLGLVTLDENGPWLTEDGWRALAQLREALQQAQQAREQARQERQRALSKQYDERDAKWERKRAEALARMKAGIESGDWRRDPRVLSAYQ